MFDTTKIQTGLTGLVGIRQPFNPAYAKLDAANQASRSGFFLDDISNFKLAFHIDTQDYKDITDADLNIQLRSIQDAAIVQVCQSVFGSRSYIDRNLVYTHANTRQDLETTLLNGFVGFRITPSATKDVAFKITRLQIELDGLGDVTIVLFNSAVNTPIQTKVVTIASNSQIEQLDWVVNNTDGDYKGDYYLGYVFDGNFTPYKRDFENSQFENSISEIDYERIYVAGANDSSLFDLDDVYSLSENTGLNPDITVFDDFTDLILQNESLFAKAIQLQWAILIMQRYISTTRSNNMERIAKDTILRTIETIEGSVSTSPIKVTGLNSYLGSELESLRMTIEELQKGYFGSGVQVKTLS